MVLMYWFQQNVTSKKKKLFIHSLKRSPRNPEGSGGKSSKMFPPEKSAQKQKETTQKGWTWPFGLDMIVSVVSLYPHPSPRYTLYSIASLPRSDVEIRICTSWTCNNGNGHAVLVLIGNWCLEISPHVRYICIMSVYINNMCIIYIY